MSIFGTSHRWTLYCHEQKNKGNNIGHQILSFTQYFFGQVSDGDISSIAINLFPLFLLFFPNKICLGHCSSVNVHFFLYSAIKFLHSLYFIFLKGTTGLVFLVICSFVCSLAEPFIELISFCLCQLSAHSDFCFSHGKYTWLSLIFLLYLFALRQGFDTPVLEGLCPATFITCSWSNTPESNG